MRSAINAMIGTIIVFATAVNATIKEKDAFSPGPFHPECVMAYNNLPLSDENLAEFKGSYGNYGAFVDANKELFLRFDRDCLDKWENLQQHTKQFLENNVGTIFDSAGVPFCAGFRIRPDVLMTAGHCDATQGLFRLFGYPNKSLLVGEKVELSNFDYGRVDLGDIGLWHIQSDNIPFTWTTADFTRNTEPTQAINIVAFDWRAFHLLLDERPERWLEAVRFARLNSARLYTASEIGKPEPTGPFAEECLFHRAQSLPGMSGAPILAWREPISAGEKLRFFVIGIHLRNGMDHAGGAGGCGERRGFNIGIRIPARVLQYIGDKTENLH